MFGCSQTSVSTRTLSRQCRRRARHISFVFSRCDMQQCGGVLPCEISDVLNGRDRRSICARSMLSASPYFRKVGAVVLLHAPLSRLTFCDRHAAGPPHTGRETVNPLTPSVGRRGCRRRGFDALRAPSWGRDEGDDVNKSAASACQHTKGRASAAAAAATAG